MTVLEQSDLEFARMCRTMTWEALARVVEREWQRAKYDPRYNRPCGQIAEREMGQRLAAISRRIG